MQIYDENNVYKYTYIPWKTKIIRTLYAISYRYMVWYGNASIYIICWTLVPRQNHQHHQLHFRLLFRMHYFSIHTVYIYITCEFSFKKKCIRNLSWLYNLELVCSGTIMHNAHIPIYYIVLYKSYKRCIKGINCEMYAYQWHWIHICSFWGWQFKL